MTFRLNGPYGTNNFAGNAVYNLALTPILFSAYQYSSLRLPHLQDDRMVRVKQEGAALDAMYDITLIQQEIGQIGTVLSSDASNHCYFVH